LKKIVILGATGSIGTQTLDVVRRQPDRLKVVGLSAYQNEALLRRQAEEFQVPATGLELGEKADLVRLAAMDTADLVVVAVAGSVGLAATLAALEAGKDVALATKEVLVAAGELVTAAARRSGVNLLPLDSEHSAIFQCLQGNRSESVRKILLTASGGPFRGWDWKQIENVTLEQALRHPTWPSMGRKITIDSATLMNKGLETIEAQWLFHLPIEQIEVIIHPQSIIHSFVEFQDGSLLSQMGVPDMRLPIAYALLYPQRIDLGLTRLDLTRMEAPLTFEVPDYKAFPCLDLAKQAAQQGGTMPAVLNSANEAAVELFLEGKIRFMQIPQLIEKAMQQHHPDSALALSQIMQADAWARQTVKEQVHGCIV
jgi:1-deoxy-D-xylulose-5-phosphate reductoisomerase